MNCIFCDNQVINRRKGDHIIPQGLGRFSPELTVFCICKKCDSQHGNQFERIALRTGIIGTFRAVKGIKSKNHKRLPVHSPSLDKFRAIESLEFAISNTSDPNETIYVAGDGNIRYSNVILIKKNGIVADSINIPPTRDIREMCNFIEAKIPQKLADYECDLYISEQQMGEVSKELARRGRKLEDIPIEAKPPELKIIKISSLLTDNHIRFVASVVLKGMIYLSYPVGLLRPIIDFVKTGDPGNLIYRYIDKQESGCDMLDDPPLNVFYHSFEWNITENSITITSSLLAHKNVNGIRVRFALKAGKDSSILIPYGKIVAKYGNTPDDGILEIYRGDSQVEV